MPASHWISREADEVLQPFAPPTLDQERASFGANGIGRGRLQVRPAEMLARPGSRVFLGSRTFLPAEFCDVWGGVAGSEREPAERLQLVLDLSLAYGPRHHSYVSIHESPVASRPAHCYTGGAVGVAPESASVSVMIYDYANVTI